MSQLTYKECCQIQVLLKENYTHREIGTILQRSNKTISQEVKRYSTNGTYIADMAWITGKTKRGLVNSLIHCRIKRGSNLEKYILEKIHLHWSPEQIIWNKEHPLDKVCTKTVYNFIKRTHPDLAKRLFRRKGKPYKYGTVQAKYIYDRTSIRDSPESINNYEDFGHWEVDTMWRKGYKWRFVTLTERKSKMELAYFVTCKNAIVVTQALSKMIQGIPKSLMKSITFDNGTEFVNHFELKALYGIKTYFCDPGAPGQRGLNENFNGLLREFAPKNCIIISGEQKDVDKMVDLLNNRPRKSLNYCTPLEYLRENVINI